MQPPVEILGVPVSPWDEAGLLDAIIASAEGNSSALPSRATVHYANVHVLNTAFGDPGLHAQLNRASTVFCDGDGVRFAAWILGGRLPHRLGAGDIIGAFCEKAAAAGVRLYFVAGAPGVADQAAAILTSRHPGLRIVGTHHGYLDDKLSEDVAAAANRVGTDIVMVGMGTPVQERWVARYRDRLDAGVVWTVGALFDFIAGAQRRAPRWLIALHLEWLWRLGTDPRRLAGRYLIGNPLFLIRILRQRLRKHAP